MKSIVCFKILPFSFFLLVCVATFAQSDNDIIEKGTSELKKGSKELKKSIPEEYVKIDKEYDEDGNLIRFNKIRTLYHSSIKDGEIIDQDVFDELTEMMKEENLRKNPFFESLYSGNDSFMKNLEKDDFFQNFYKENLKGMGDVFKKMDTYKNGFFDDKEENKVKKDKSKSEDKEL